MITKKKWLQGGIAAFIVMLIMGCLMLVMANEERDIGGWNLATASDAYLATASKGIKITAAYFEDSQGNQLENGAEIDVNANFMLVYQFEIDDEVNNNDTAYIYLPEQLNFESWQTGNGSDPLFYIYIEGEEAKPENLIAAVRYTLYRGRPAFELIFGEAVESYQSLSAYLSVYMKFDRDKVTVGKETEIILDGTGEFHITITVVDDEIPANVIKQAGDVEYKDQDKLTEDQDYYLITWSITVNEDGGQMKYPIVTDRLPVKVTYVETISITDGEGNASESVWAFETLVGNDDNGHNVIILQWTYTDSEATSGTYNFLFTTKIFRKDLVDYYEIITEDTVNSSYFGGIYQIVNNGYLNYEYGGEPRSDKDYDLAEIKPRLLFKDVEYSAGSMKIIWSIVINEEKWTLTNASLKDIIPAGLKLTNVEYRVDDGNYIPATLSDNYDYSFVSETEESILTVDLTKVDNPLKSKVEIRYETEILDESFFKMNREVTFKNKVKLYFDEIGTKPFEYERPKKIISVLLSKSGKQDAQEQQKIDWEIFVNANRQEFFEEDVVVTDTFDTDVLALDKTSIKIYLLEVDGSRSIIQDNNITVNTSVDGTIIVTFPDDLMNGNAYIIEFTTQIINTETLFTPDENGKPISFTYENLVKLKSGRIEEQDGDKVQYKPDIIQKSTGVSPYYDYELRRISWQIRVNSDSFEIGAATLTDYLPAGLSLVDDSINVKFTDSNNPIAETDSNYPDFQGITMIGGRETFSFKFINLNKAVTIEFDADIIDDELFLDIKNDDVKLVNQAELLIDLTGERFKDDADVTIKNKVVEKTAEYQGNTDYIDWTVRINANAIPWDISGMWVEDALAEGLELDTGSIRLIQYELKNNNDNAEYVKVTEIALTKDNISYNRQTNIFRFIFPDDLEMGYVYDLLFTTDVSKAGDYDNTIYFHGNTIIYEDYETVKVIFGGGGSGSGTKPMNPKPKTEIKITKWNEDGTKNLTGVEFELFDLYESSIEKKTTDENGQLTFVDIRYNATYYIREVKAPEGYQIGEIPWTISQTDAVLEAVSGEAGYYRLTIGNDEAMLSVAIKLAVFNRMFEDEVEPPDASKPPKGQVEILKLDNSSDSLPIAGVKFELQRKSNREIVASGITKADGILVFKDIDDGEYLLVEISAPEGYLLSNEQREVIIDSSNSNNLYQYTIINTKITATVEVMKVSSTNSYNRLSGAKFELYQGGTVDDKYNIVGGLLIDNNYETDEQGMISLGELEYGIYYLKEIQAPSGYRLPANPVTRFTIDEKNHGTVVTLEIKNQKRNTSSGGGSDTTPPVTTQPITQIPELTTTAPVPETPPDLVLPPGYTYEYDEERGEWMILDPNGVPMGWLDNPEDVLPSVPKTGDDTTIVLVVILLIGTGVMMMALLSGRRRRIK